MLAAHSRPTNVTHDLNEKTKGRSALLRVRRGALAIAVFVVAAVHPAGGLGIDLCPSRLFFHIPCPGCGITRSISCTIRGRFAEAVTYNLFGPIVIAVCLLLLASALLPGTWTAAICRRLAWTEATTTRLIWGLGLAFITFGVIRALLQFAA